MADFPRREPSVVMLDALLASVSEALQQAQDDVGRTWMLVEQGARPVESGRPGGQEYLHEAEVEQRLRAIEINLMNTVIGIRIFMARFEVEES